MICLLLNAGCNYRIADDNHESPWYISLKSGIDLSDIARQLDSHSIAEEETDYSNIVLFGEPSITYSLWEISG